MGKEIIKSIELDLDGKIVKLTPKQAENLRDVLNELFAKEVVVPYIPQKEYVPYPVYPPRPYWWEYQPYRITYGDYDTSGTYTPPTFCSSSNILRLTG